MSVLSPPAISSETTYLYAVVPGDCPELEPPLGLVRSGELAAVVSAPPACFLELASELGHKGARAESLESLEEALRTHEEVIERLQPDSIVPLRFGTTLRSRDDVVDFLRRNDRALCESLARVAGRAEWTLRVWARPPTSSPAAEDHAPAARSGRAYLERRRDEKEAISRERRERDEMAAAITARLSPVVSGMTEPSPTPPVGRAAEDDPAALVLHLVCLVSRGEERWLEVLEQAVKEVTEDGQAEVTGPWPPYHFVSLFELPESAEEKR